MMIGIYKTNEVSTIGGTTPQGDGINLSGTIKEWNIVTVPDNQISSVQEFDIQPVADNFAEAISGPQQEGAYNAPAMTINGFGDKMRIEMNPGQLTPDGEEIVSPDAKDTESQKNFTSEDIKPYQEAYNFIKKFTAKSLLRNDIRGNIIDIEDDIADTKHALQTAMYYMAHEWNSRTDAQKATNTGKDAMDKLTTKLLSDETKMSVDLSNGIAKLTKIIETEEVINNLVTETYKYDANRGV